MKPLVRPALLCLCIVWFLLQSANSASSKKWWITLDNCHLVANPANDGDSFHVASGPNEYVFRLYFVDAPETNQEFPERVTEQAKYFSITIERALEIGEAAKHFTEETLAKPFKVHTCMQRALGQSAIPRFYAFVESRSGDLGEQLVANGYARAHGVEVASPEGLDKAEVESERLWELERKAKAKRVGAWSRHFITPDLDANAATTEQLEALPSIGKVIAARIIAARPFKSADDLRNVEGIGRKRYKQIRPYFSSP